VLEQAQNPHSTIWENKHFSQKQMQSRLMKFVLGLFLYMVVVSVFLITLKDFLAWIAEPFYFLPYCQQISQMFQNDSKQFENYALLDQRYLKNAQTTGIYECYCANQVSIFTFYKNIYKRQNQFCSNYMWSMNGGSLITLP